MTPVNAAQMCAYFVRLGDPAGRTEDDRKCGFAYREGEQRITGSLSFQGPGLTPAGLDRQVRYDELWSNSPWEEPLDPDLTLSRPRPDILIHRMPRASEEIHAFTVTCGSFDLTGWVRTLDATEVAVALADRWCAAS